ncbi:MULTISPECIES: 3-deoxy-7-phosphoheptulonate synthase [Dehalococcoides]|uniref:3-deoxy-D-arabino-heptulosonate 7-phosphate (DAHP) synthase n=1 Tax=Dehalococcoides mccartyi TaxID=61435 RepID=A0A142VBD8_9CHLR|nr:3-deoxy-7-phosphoheptulonate synthase [Dehalococcoides mccartyi]AII61421.1 3-deoxy-7-phosphoheptulonate synthase [Dehalococcoides mccartyi CG5]AMU87128.1 3-deoxy-D-arabino-heptulosonate 7-phosphate (DAHP) synthase [Dehalococcoides mccartyi]AOV99910.1 2-keto-3-deoxy-D-arabino-heptulosonate-7-phosphate synthase I beta [Dehalococcoides mccartyi]AQW62916.1 3-deoxy-7-phosphoheptulonate synthase [Dehalococcoides mccartyi]MBA2085693.1 2-keto-3-deoxy-D-arabino-heptulosonate-7- phosphate synthase I 
MLVIMKNDATQEQIDNVIREITDAGYRGIPIPGDHRTAVCIVGNQGMVEESPFLALEGVKEVLRVTKPYKLVSHETCPKPTVIRLGEVEIGNGCKPVIIAGPCSVESEEQTLRIALQVKEGGAKLFRGGAFKPRTSPYSFQGLGKAGLKILEKVRSETGLFIVTEATDSENLKLVEASTDIIQIGARNMQNYSLLRRAGQTKKPVILKRGLSATIEELLMAAEYIMAEGNTQVILCERGIRTFSDNTRFTLDLSAILSVKALSHLPIIVDPSHAAGRRDYVIPLSRAAIATGADGLIVEVHSDPPSALSDGAQSLYPEQFCQLVKEVEYLNMLGVEKCLK